MLIKSDPEQIAHRKFRPRFLLQKKKKKPFYTFYVKRLREVD